jgi:hypothetical protein
VGSETRESDDGEQNDDDSTIDGSYANEDNDSSIYEDD